MRRGFERMGYSLTSLSDIVREIFSGMEMPEVPLYYQPDRMEISLSLLIQKRMHHRYSIDEIELYSAENPTHSILENLCSIRASLDMWFDAKVCL